MKKLLIVADMEGCIGVHNMADYEQSQRLMNVEVEYLLRRIDALNCFDITVVDSHNDGVNLKPTAAKYPAVTFVPHIWSVDNLSSFDCAILTGVHAKAGANGWYSHSWRTEFESVKLGNKTVGETELLVNILAYYEVAVAAVVGDESARTESEELDIPFLSVKESGRITEPQKKVYEEMAEFVVSVLQKPQKRVHTYTDAEVSISFYNKLYLRCLPESLFEIRNDKVVFSQTVSFFRNIYNLSVFINSGRQLQREFLLRFKRVLRAEYTRESFELVCDQMIRSVLDKSFEMISFEDMACFTRFAADYGLTKRWELAIADE